MFSQTWIMGKSKAIKMARLWMLQHWNFFYFCTGIQTYILEFYENWHITKERHKYIFVWWVRSLHVEAKVFACMRTFFRPKIIPNQTVPVGHSLHRPLTMLSFFLCVSVSDFFSCWIFRRSNHPSWFCLCFHFFLALTDEDSPAMLFQKLFLRNSWPQWNRKY